MSEEGHEGLGLLVGYLTVYGQWVEHDSASEGHYIECMARGSFTKTIREGPSPGVTFCHGTDERFGDKPLGPIMDLTEDDYGVHYSVLLLDTSLNRGLVPGLLAGAYGSSCRTHVLAEDFNKNPGTSAHNPDGLPERTITEVFLQEFGPVREPLYKGTSAALLPYTHDRTPPRNSMTTQTTLASRRLDMQLDPDYVAMRLASIDPSLCTPSLVQEVARAAHAARRRREVLEHIESLKKAQAGATTMRSYGSLPYLSGRLEDEQRYLERLAPGEIDAGISAAALDLAAQKLAEATERLATPPELAYSLERAAWESLPDEVFPVISPVVTRPEDATLAEKVSHRIAIADDIAEAVAAWHEVRHGGEGDTLRMLAAATTLLGMLRDLDEATLPLREEVDAANRRRRGLGFEWVAPVDTETPDTHRLARFRAAAFQEAQA